MQTATEGARTSRIVTTPFLVAVGLLGLAAVLAGPIARMYDVKQVKHALPLKRPLATLNADALRPYKVTQRDVLETTVVEALGTEEYLSWRFEDESLPEDDPLRYGSLLVTYYTGGHALVPHTPDVCYLGAGYSEAEPHAYKDITVPSLGEDRSTLPIRVCTFAKTAIHDRAKTSVVYTFFCNGRFVAARLDVRLLTHDPRDKHAFFSKVEVSFPMASRAQNIEGAKKLFGKVLPLLMRGHWPDFEAAEKAASQDGDG